MTISTIDEIRNPKRVQQLSLFPSSSDQAPSGLVGLKARIERGDTPQACGTCGSYDAVLGSSCGPHAAGIYCICGKHRGWVSRQRAERLLEIQQRFGIQEPIIFRTEKHRTFTAHDTAGGEWGV